MVTRLVSWIVASCLLLVQAHYLVPHHHHENGSHKHLAQSVDSESQDALNSCHPEFIGHDDVPSDDALRRFDQAPVAALLASSELRVEMSRELLFALQPLEGGLSGRPHGPPCTLASPRAPPTTHEPLVAPWVIV